MAAPDYTRFLSGPPAVQVNTPAPVEAPDINPLARKLDAVTERALDKLDELLTLPTDTQDGHRTRAQTSAANTVISAQVRVDESRLRARGQVDLLPKILEMIKEEKAALARATQETEDG
jgi:hypothetical protein